MNRHPAAKTGDLPPGGRKLVTIGRVEIGLFNVSGEYRAYRNVCPHAGAPVCLGRVGGTSLPSEVYEYKYGREGSILRCPWHGWEFDLRTGANLVDPRKRLKAVPVEAGPRGAGPAAAGDDLDRFPVEVSDGTLYVIL